MWWVIWSNAISKPDPIRDKNFGAFSRIDYKYWSYWKAIITHFFFWPRFIIGWSAFIGVGVFARIISIGYDPKKLPEWRASAVRKATTWAGLIVCWCACIFPKKIRISADYTKYLGPNYKITYEGAGIHVS